MSKPFNGTVKLDIRDSVPDWDAFLETAAPKDAPNVLVILYDDTGCASWSPYGGRINMPTLDRLANDGLTARTLGASFNILAEVEFTSDTKGVIVSQGSRFGGYTLFVKDGRLNFVYNFLGIPPDKMTLYVDEKACAAGQFRTQSGHYALAGEGLAVGRDTDDPATRAYEPYFPFTGGAIRKVEFDVAGDAYVDEERRLTAVLARD